MRTGQSTALKVPWSLHPHLLPISRAMFHHCNNFTIAGGTFTVLERPRSPPSNFRSIRLGDLNLLAQMGNEEELTSEVVEFDGRDTVVWRKVVVGARKVYRARIFGSQDPMTAVVYKGSQFEKWKSDAERRQIVRSPRILQLFGITKSSGVNALIYYDELITVAQFRQMYRGSTLISEYIEYQMARDRFRAYPYTHLTPSIRVSTGRLCYHDLFLQSDGRPQQAWGTSAPLIPWEETFSVPPGTRDIEEQLLSRMEVGDIHAMVQAFSFSRTIMLSVHDSVPLGKLVTVDGGVLDFQVRFPDSKLSKVKLGVGSWRLCGGQICHITVGDTRWTRIVLPAASKTELNFLSYYNSMDSAAYIWKSWLSRAHCLLKSGIATGLELDDLILIHAVTLMMRLHYPEQNTVPAPKLPYLFVSSPAACFEEDGTAWIEIQPPDQRYYWSLDPLGGEPLAEDLTAQFSLPQVMFEVEARGNSWTTAQYDLLRKFHEAKGVDYNI